MKRITLKLTSLILTVAMVFTLATTVSAAPSRETGKTKYLSDIVLIEASNYDEANEILTELKKDENGAFEGMVNVDLNQGGKKVVYLAYKTSTNVDDAITDISVMNMNGDFTMGNYGQLFNETVDDYCAIVQKYRKIAAEFKKNYEANNNNALLAYRQMNYYYLTKDDGTKINMGDYMLNFPAADYEFAKVLFMGNVNIVSNLRTLLAMGVGNTDVALLERISNAYASAAADPSVYENAAYEDVAKQIYSDVKTMKEDILTLESEYEKIKTTELTEEDKALATDAVTASLNASKSFLELLKEINIDPVVLNANVTGTTTADNGGMSTLGEYVMGTTIIEPKMFFPIVAAATEAEKILLEFGSFNALLLYDVIEKSSKALEEELQELEETYTPVSVFHGVQNDLMDGTIAVTGDAELTSSTTGRSFFDIYGGNTLGSSIGYTVLGIAGLGFSIAGVAYLIVKESGAKAAYESLKFSLDTAITQQQAYYSKLVGWVELYQREAMNVGGMYYTMPAYKQTLEDSVIRSLSKYNNAVAEVSELTDDLANTSQHLTKAQAFVGGAMIAVGVVMMGISIWQLTKIYNKYKTSYTDIPDNMVDVVAHETLGDRFINYKNVLSFYYKDGDIFVRENDLNAYDGLEWVSMYYTKNFEAGYCLVASPDLIATETVRDGYSAINLFGHTQNYNLNSFSNRDNAEAVYLSFKYSTNQKSAETDIPDVIGSAFNVGVIAISALGGFIVGAGLMGILYKVKPFRKKKKEELEAEETEVAETEADETNAEENKAEETETAETKAEENKAE